MSDEQEIDRDISLLLASEDRANGFSMIADESNNITLLKCSKPVAWFSAVVTEEVVVAFLKLIKDSERSDNKHAGIR